MHCDFHLAKELISDFFALSEREAKASGQQAFYKKDLVAAWKAFEQHPDYENAIRFIESTQGSQATWASFLECCPGGRFFVYKSVLK